MHLLCLFRGGCFTCTNGPDRLICNYQFWYLINSDFIQDGIELLHYHFLLITTFSLIKFFASAHYRGQIIKYHFTGLVGNKIIVFCIILTAFRVANNYIFTACVFYEDTAISLSFNASATAGIEIDGGDTTTSQLKLPDGQRFASSSASFLASVGPQFIFQFPAIIKLLMILSVVELRFFAVPGQYCQIQF